MGILYSQQKPVSPYVCYVSFRPEKFVSANFGVEKSCRFASRQTEQQDFSTSLVPRFGRNDTYVKTVQYVMRKVSYFTAYFY